MTRDHKFFTILNKSRLKCEYLTIFHFCKKCNKNAQNLYDELYELPNEVYLKFTNDVKQQINCLNFYLPCLSDEEYLIKNIIE